MAALLAAPLPALERLWLDQSGIGEQGAAAIAAASARLTNVCDLNLEYNFLGDSGSRALAQAPFQWLSWLRLRENNIGEEGKAALDTAMIDWCRYESCQAVL